MNMLEAFRKCWNCFREFWNHSINKFIKKLAELSVKNHCSSQRGTRADSLRCAYAQRVVEAGLPEDRDHGPELREGPQRQGRTERGEVHHLQAAVPQDYQYPEFMAASASPFEFLCSQRISSSGVELHCYKQCMNTTTEYTAPKVYEYVRIHINIFLTVILHD